MSDGRNELGQFAPGNAGGPGRPVRRVEREYLESLRDAVMPEDWVAIAARAVTDAKAGDARARAWLSAYLLGSPDQTVLARLAALDASAERASKPPTRAEREADELLHSMGLLARPGDAEAWEAQKRRHAEEDALARAATSGHGL